jgi:hypothetical protein
MNVTPAATLQYRPIFSFDESSNILMVGVPTEKSPISNPCRAA